MKAKIIEAFRPRGENIIEFEYQGGAKRYSYIDGWGYFIFTKTQESFLKNARCKKISTGTIWKEQNNDQNI